jgi:hypothetical protein
MRGSGRYINIGKKMRITIAAASIPSNRLTNANSTLTRTTYSRFRNLYSSPLDFSDSLKKRYVDKPKNHSAKLTIARTTLFAKSENIDK